MHSKPVIGINADFRSAKKDAPAFSYLCSGYYEAITKMGGLPLVIPPMEEADDLSAVLDLMDGMVMIGGADIDPRRDGFMTHPAIRTLEPRREDFDRMLIEMIAARRMPLLAIGSGMQLLNVSQGGNLLFHIPEDLPKALPHKDSMDPNHRHALEVVPGTLMERVYGEGEIRVNSMHHMAVDEPAPGVMISARCPDGVAEAIEYVSSEWFAVGVQFHPESPSASALDMRVFDEFVMAVSAAKGMVPPLQLHMAA